jgi:hypothetical protein
MKQIEQRLAALEATQPASSIVHTASAVARLVDDGVLVFTGGQFVAADNAPDTMPILADLLNVAKERWERAQQ